LPNGPTISFWLHFLVISTFEKKNLKKAGIVTMAKSGYHIVYF